jgi:cytochrome c-type biogenesis protein CcmF
MMKKPYIRKSLLYDLYFSPQQVQEGSNDERLKFVKGESKQIDDYAFTFTGFSMGPHGQSQSELRVTAQFLVERGHGIDTIAPAVVVVTAEDGSSSTMDFPAWFGDSNQYQISITRILADEKAVVLSIPGLIDADESETLILDVTKKPVINLVWIGTTFILLGSLITFLRRRAEL